MLLLCCVSFPSVSKSTSTSLRAMTRITRTIKKRNLRKNSIFYPPFFSHSRFDTYDDATDGNTVKINNMERNIRKVYLLNPRLSQLSTLNRRWNQCVPKNYDNFIFHVEMRAGSHREYNNKNATRVNLFNLIAMKNTYDSHIVWIVSYNNKCYVKGRSSSREGRDEMNVRALRDYKFLWEFQVLIHCFEMKYLRGQQSVWWNCLHTKHSTKAEDTFILFHFFSVWNLAHAEILPCQSIIHRHTHCVYCSRDFLPLP